MAERFDTSERAREEFFSEAQELVDSVGRSLLVLDEAVRSGRPDPEVVNDIFRAVHTLKGLAGLFGVDSHASHRPFAGGGLGEVQLAGATRPAPGSRSRPSSQCIA